MIVSAKFICVTTFNVSKSVQFRTWVCVTHHLYIILHAIIMWNVIDPVWCVCKWSWSMYRNFVRLLSVSTHRTARNEREQKSTKKKRIWICVTATDSSRYNCLVFFGFVVVVAVVVCRVYTIFASVFQYAFCVCVRLCVERTNGVWSRRQLIHCELTTISWLKIVIILHLCLAFSDFISKKIQQCRPQRSPGASEWYLRIVCDFFSSM